LARTYTALGDPSAAVSELPVKKINVPRVSSWIDHVDGTIGNVNVGLNAEEVTALNGAIVGLGTADVAVEGLGAAVGAAALATGAWLPTVGATAPAHPATRQEATVIASVDKARCTAVEVKMDMFGLPQASGCPSRRGPGSYGPVVSPPSRASWQSHGPIQHRDEGRNAS
jgi:hypothetical protein